MIQITIISPEGILQEINNAKAVHAILVDGSRITILPNHAPLIAQLKDSSIRVFTSNLEHTIPISDGILRLKENIISVLTSNTIPVSGGQK